MLVVCLFNALATVLQMKDTGKGKKGVELNPFYWTCPGCTAESQKVQDKGEGRRDTQAHILTCAGVPCPVQGVQEPH